MMMMMVVVVVVVVMQKGLCPSQQVNLDYPTLKVMT
jgi:hypothetical protein